MPKRPSKKTHGRLLDPADRAICRALRAQGVSYHVILDYVGVGTIKTTQRACNNTYSPPDDVSLDAALLPRNIKEIARMLKAKHRKGGSIAKSSALAEKKPVPSGSGTPPIVLVPRLRALDRPIKNSPSTESSADSSNSRLGSPEFESLSALPSRPSIITQRNATGASGSDDFLLAFVLSIPLDPSVADRMRAAGWTEAKLYKIARAGPGMVGEFVEGEPLVKGLKNIDKVTLRVAICELANGEEV
ncbi:hypothetical protein FB45DRAFT_1064548 [Roridomyces roridus]|uniref:Uncharacterized protein n=1 Tax=Roridomyces roridus TaxID=1738132 RepID=A0AAD7FE76_9AGAR|nr:hypothetical protein FB45DRAFT_1064548 [Roridomyces roridus]